MGTGQRGFVKMAGLDSNKQRHVEQPVQSKNDAGADNLHVDPKQAYLEHAGKAKENKPDFQQAFNSLINSANNAWGTDNVQRAHLKSGDIDGAVVVAALGPGTYNALHESGLDLHNLGKGIREYAQVVSKQIEGFLHPGLPKVVTDAESNAKTNAQMEHITSAFLSASETMWDPKTIADLNIDKRDAGAAFALYLLGPDEYKRRGHDRAKHDGDQAILFVVAPALGLAQEAKEQITKNFAQFAHELSANALIGYGLGALTKLVPGAAVPLAALGLTMTAKDQLLDPKNQERNRELWQIGHAGDDLKTGQMIAAINRVKDLTGPSAYHASLAAIGGAAGFKPGEALGASARQLPFKNIPGMISSARSGISDKLAGGIKIGSKLGDRPAFAAATGDASLANLEPRKPEIPNVAKMSAEKPHAADKVDADAIIAPAEAAAIIRAPKSHADFQRLKEIQRECLPGFNPPKPGDDGSLIALELPGKGIVGYADMDGSHVYAIAVLPEYRGDATKLLFKAINDHCRQTGDGWITTAARKDTAYRYLMAQAKRGNIELELQYQGVGPDKKHIFNTCRFRFIDKTAKR